MAPSKLKNMAICFSGAFDHPESQLRKWTEANGGEFHRQIKSDTTHLVTTKANWRSRVPEVKAALSNDRSVKIVDYEWFDDKLRLGGRVSENKYLWTTIDEEAFKRQAKDERAAEREKKRIEKEKEKKKKESERIDWSGALLQHTNVVARVEDSEDSEDSGDSAGRELQEEFARGVKQAKEDLMSDNHHIYIDQTGFSMDITLTKASVELSHMDRAQITLYETNDVPHTYAVAAKVAENDPIDHGLTIIIGVNYATAFRTFRHNFQKLAGFEWNNRFEKSTDRATLAPLPRPKYDFIVAGKGSPPGKLAKKGKEKAGEPGEPTSEQVRERLEAAFIKQKYRYRLPDAGTPCGTMIDGSHYKHQNKSVYELFGKAADRGAEAIKIKEEAKAESKRLLKNLKKRQGPVEVVIIDSDDDEDDESEGEEDDESDEDEEMEGIQGYVAVKAPVAGNVVLMDLDGPARVEEDYTMVDAPNAQI
ncbi:hypothetical protein D6D27_04351 [Aureobasidium pullulans]|nr:hypothetical protein D6D27_04351 [Aureobasidium pullulans]